jgi:hypothetical protein
VAVLPTLTFAALAAATLLACSDGAGSPTGPSGQAVEAGFVSLFDGRGFDGWTGAVNAYEVVDGAMVCRSGASGTIFTSRQFRNFEVRFEFLLPPAGNNGLVIRYPGTGDGAFSGMAEIQVLDDTHPNYANLDPRQVHGSAYGMVGATRGHLRPVGQWNSEEVRVVGSTVRVTLNGTVILDTDLSTVTTFLGNDPHPGKDRTEGHVGFASHGDPVRFRHIRIRELP